MNSKPEEIIKNLIKYCETFDEFPHHFDDTLLDKFIEAIEYNDDVLKTIKCLMKCTDFEENCIPIQIILRLVDAAVKIGRLDEDSVWTSFITRSEVLLEQNRPVNVIHDLYRLYGNLEVFGLRKPDSWLKVIHYSLTHIDEASTSIFLRRKFSKFLTQLQPYDARRLLVISGILQIFCRRISCGSFDSQIVDICTRILKPYDEELAVDECYCLLDSILNTNKRVGENSLLLMIELKRKHNSLTIPLLPMKWKNESNRVEFVVMSVNKENKNCDEALNLIIDSPALKASHIISIIHLLSEENVTQFLQRFSQEASKSWRITQNDISQLISKLPPTIDLNIVANFLQAIGDRALESSNPFSALREKFGSNIFETPEFKNYREILDRKIKNKINTSSWEVIDTILEISNIFPIFLPSREKIETIIKNGENTPYLLASALQILHDHFDGIPVEDLIAVLIKCPDTAPRLVALKSLRKDQETNNLKLSTDVLLDIISSCLNDLDIGLRNEALVMATKLMRSEEDETTQELVAILQQWADDQWIGEKICAILQLKQPVRENETMDGLASLMIQSLRLNTASNDNVMDCY